MNRLLAACLVVLVLVSPAVAGKGVPTFAEVAVDLGSDGRASVEYTVAYRVVEGEFHGFYFTGPQIDSLRPAWDDGWGRAKRDRTSPSNSPAQAR